MHMVYWEWKPIYMIWICCSILIEIIGRTRARPDPKSLTYERDQMWQRGYLDIRRNGIGMLSIRRNYTFSREIEQPVLISLSGELKRYRCRWCPIFRRLKWFRRKEILPPSFCGVTPSDTTLADPTGRELDGTMVTEMEHCSGRWYRVSTWWKQFCWIGVAWNFNEKASLAMNISLRWDPYVSYYPSEPLAEHPFLQIFFLGLLFINLLRRVLKIPTRNQE